jgi:type I restriction enzyme R subunit
MPDIPSFKEDHISQIPAIQLLIQLGYEYMPPAQALTARHGKNSHVILETVLENWLKQNNRITYKGKQYPFSESGIRDAISALKDLTPEGLLRENETIYDLLCLGKSIEQTIDGDKKSFSLKYIDWDHSENNIFHAVAEFEVTRTRSDKTRRPDIVLFVNGIPLAVIENKRPDIKDPIGEAVSQNIRNQGEDEIPALFRYVQIILALSKNQAKYATVGSPAKFWTVWRENEPDEILSDLINRPLSETRKAELFSPPFAECREYFEDLEKQGPRLISEQDRSLYGLCRPERLLELTYRFIVFDAGVKKIARYQQYFTVKETLERIRIYNDNGSRKGGVIWHTQGSGKSLTMVMLAKALSLAPDISNPRIVIVTDRRDLDDQINKTFRHCGKKPVKAGSGDHLMRLLSENKASIITTVIDKFMAGMKKTRVKNESPEIFVLVDESHRSQYGQNHAVMRKALPNACYLGFTGTPLLKKDKNTALKFGGFIFNYTIEDALRDNVIVPLLYEGRHAEQSVDKKQIDRWFEIHTRSLTPEQKKDLKKKFSTADQLNKAEKKIMEVAADISLHYSGLLKNTPYKAQLTAPAKKIALKYKHYLDEIGMVSSEVLISGPDMREGHEEVDAESSDDVQTFWKKMMDQYGTEEKYNQSLIDRFKSAAHPEILIVVDKLLTGFDEPLNTVLYITRSLKAHTLLQAVARVNRICEGKEFGYIIDYYGILGELDKALTAYSALAGFDEKDLENALTNMLDEVRNLPQRHSELWDIFKTVQNRKDELAYQELLADEELRLQFYEALSAYARTLQTALASNKFIAETDDRTITRYKEDLKFFMGLRQAVRQRYGEAVDFKEYEERIRKLVDDHVSTDEVSQLTELVNIFDKDAFALELAKLQSPGAKADTIAHRVKKTISEKMEEDPRFYKKFSKMLEETIRAYREKRISDLEYLKTAGDIMENVREHRDENLPSKLKNSDAAPAFYGAAMEVLQPLPGYGPKEITDISADIGLKTEAVVRRLKVVDWVHNPDIQNLMRNEIEDYLYEIQDQRGLELSEDDMDLIMEKCLEIAKNRYAE